MEWQPIDTAPKTGRTILLGYRNSHGNWRTMRGQWFSKEAIAEEWEAIEDYDNPEELEGWHETSVEADDVPNCWATKPTHWMPLPEAPNDQAQGEAQGSSRLSPGATGSATNGNGGRP